MESLILITWIQCIACYNHLNLETLAIIAIVLTADHQIVAIIVIVIIAVMAINESKKVAVMILE